MVKLVTANLQNILAPIVAELGYEWWGCVHTQNGRRQLLRVYIDNPKGVTVDDCALVSRQVAAILDVEDPLTGNYTLEVSSPGLDRPLFTLEQYKRYVGQDVRLQLREPVQRRRHYRGTLLEVEVDAIRLKLPDEEQEVTFPFSLIERANLVPDLD